MKSSIAIVLLLMMASIYMAEQAFADDGGGSDQAAWTKDINSFLMSCQTLPCCYANISNMTGANPCLNLNNSTASCPSCCEQSDGCARKLNASLY